MDESEDGSTKEVLAEGMRKNMCVGGYAIMERGGKRWVLYGHKILRIGAGRTTWRS